VPTHPDYTKCHRRDHAATLRDLSPLNLCLRRRSVNTDIGRPVGTERSRSAGCWPLRAAVLLFLLLALKHPYIALISFDQLAAGSDLMAATAPRAPSSRTLGCRTSCPVSGGWLPCSPAHQRHRYDALTQLLLLERLQLVSAHLGSAFRPHSSRRQLTSSACTHPHGIVTS
jgi:hypothetical protein